MAETSLSKTLYDFFDKTVPETATRVATAVQKQQATQPAKPKLAAGLLPAKPHIENLVPSQQIPEGYYGKTSLSPAPAVRGKTYEELGFEDRLKVLEKNQAKHGVDWGEVINVLGYGIQKFGEQTKTKGEELISKGSASPQETAIVRSISGAGGSPFEMIGAGMQDVAKADFMAERPQYVKGTAGMGFGLMGATPVGAIWNAALNQPDIQGATQPIFNFLDEAKVQIKNLPIIKDLNPEFKDSIDLGVDLLAFYALHKAVKAPFKGKAVETQIPDIATGEVRTVKLPTDRKWWGEVKQDMAKQIEFLRKDPLGFITENQLGMSIKDVSKQPEILPPESNLKKRGFVETVEENPKISKEVKKELSESPESYYKPITNKRTLADARKIIKSDEVGAYNKVKTEGITAENTAITEVLIQKYNKAGQYDKVIDLVDTLSKNATEAGQAIQAISMFNKMTAGGILKYAKNTLEQARKEGYKIPEKLTPEQIKDFTGRIKMINGMKEGRQKTIQGALLMRDIAELKPSSFGQKVSTAQTMMQLLNPKTIGRNIIGNFIFPQMENASRQISRLLDIPVGMITGERVVTTGMKSEYAKGFMKGAKEGAEESLLGIDLSGRATQYDLPSTQYGRTFKKGILGRMEQALSLSLRAPDRAFSQGSFQKTLSEMAKLDAINKKIKPKDRAEYIKNLIENPTTDMVKEASSKALYDTFQDPNLTVAFFSGLKKTFNKIGFGKGDIKFGAGDMILKYPKTPANLLNRGVAYSPLGFVKVGKELIRGSRRGATEAAGRALIGTAIFSLGYKLASLDVLTSSYTKDADLRALEQEEGEGQYRINVDALGRWIGSGFNDKIIDTQKGDKIISYDWLQPITASVSGGAETYKKLQEKAKKGKIDITDINDLQDILSVGLQSTLFGVDALTEQPLITGVKSILSKSNVSDMIVDVVSSIPSSFTPTFLSQIRQAIDNTQRITDDPNPILKGLNKALNKIPGLNMLLPERKNIWGEQAENFQNAGNNIFNVFLNPSFVTEKKADPLNQYLMKLAVDTGKSDFLPIVSPKRLPVGKNDKDLSAKEMQTYQEAVGKVTRTNFEKMYQNPQFLSLSPEEQAKSLRKNLDKIRDLARGQFYYNRIMDMKNTNIKEAENFYNDFSDSQIDSLNAYSSLVRK